MKHPLVFLTTVISSSIESIVLSHNNQRGLTIKGVRVIDFEPVDNRAFLMLSITEFDKEWEYW